MSGPSQPASNNTRGFWSRRPRQNSDNTSTPTLSNRNSDTGFVPSRSGFTTRPQHSDYYHSASPEDSREQQHRQLRRVSSALSPPVSPAFGDSPHAEYQNRTGAEAAPISPLTPEVLKRRATRLGSLIGKGRRDEVTRGNDAVLPRSAHATQSPGFESSYAAAFGEQPRSAPSAVTTFPNTGHSTVPSNQRLSTSSSLISQPRSEPWNGGDGSSSSWRSSQQLDHIHGHMAAVVTSSPTTYSTYHFPNPPQTQHLPPAPPPPHIISAQTYPPVTSPYSMSRPPTSAPTSAPSRQQRKQSDQLDAAELAAFSEATAALSFFPEDTTDPRSSYSSIASSTRQRQRSRTPTPSLHRPTSSRSGVSPARIAAPLPPLPKDEIPASTRIPQPYNAMDVSPIRGRQGRPAGPPPQGPLPVPPPFQPIQRSTSYSSTFAHSPPPVPSTEITGDTPTTPVGVERTTHISEARSNSPYRFNLPSRTLTTVAPPPTRRPQPNYTPITRTQALAEALQGMDADDESLATGHSSGNLHGVETSAAADDELPDYATSQMEHTARQRWEAALRARELDEAWRRGRGRGLR